MGISTLKGIMVPIITPVDKDENIDYEKLGFVIERVIKGGVCAILLFGSNGEFFMFDEEEMKEALQFTIDKTNKRVPVYFGIGAIRTKTAVRLAKMAYDCKADGISILQPMFIKPSDGELYNHFAAISKAVPEDYAMLLYNNPGRCGYNLSVSLVAKLAKDFKNIVGIKDSAGDITQLMELIRCTSFKEFLVFSGKDTVVYAALAVGATGSVCSIANICPELVCGIYNEYVKGNTEKSLELQYKLNPLRLSQDKWTFPTATKLMMNLMGLEVGASILPLEIPPENIIEIMAEELRKADLLK